jgi:phosphatidate cytidylyltransferase
MLKQRVITALLMLAILIPAMLYPSPLPFGVVSLALIAAGVWEWFRLNGVAGRTAVWVALAASLGCLLYWYATGLGAPLRYLWLVVGLAWVACSVWLLPAGPSRWSGLPQGGRLAGGLFSLVVAWLAVMQARAMGVNFLLSAMALAWIADISAYFVGRAIGGRVFRAKLAPTISPGKTWEGALGGLAGVLLLSLAWTALDARYAMDSDSLYTQLSRHSPAWLVAACVFMTAMSVSGDLLESLVKRSAGVKDSSGLLPGHGGVLDRLDALLPTLPLAMMFSTLGFL